MKGLPRALTQGVGAPNTDICLRKNKQAPETGRVVLFPIRGETVFFTQMKKRRIK